MNKADIPVFILCGGMGTRLKEETDFIPKPMVTIGNQPILLHIMKKYSKHGFKKFILCLGFKSEVIKSYFLHFSSLNSDFTINLETNNLAVHTVNHKLDWDVTLCYTGEYTMTGARVARAARQYLGNADLFGVTYGDGLTSANLSDELDFHLKHKRTGTVLGVNPPSRFGEIKTSDENVIEFDEKPEFSEKWINGGYFFFQKEFLNYLSEDESCILERTPLVQLAREHQLNVYKHRGFWECMDTQRDRDNLESVWKNENVPWL